MKTLKYSFQMMIFVDSEVLLYHKKQFDAMACPGDEEWRLGVNPFSFINLISKFIYFSQVE